MKMKGEARIAGSRQHRRCASLFFFWNRVFYPDYYPGYRDNVTMRVITREALGIYIFAKPANQQCICNWWYIGREELADS